jgi:hypothetical protein
MNQPYETPLVSMPVEHPKHSTWNTGSLARYETAQRAKVKHL